MHDSLECDQSNDGLSIREPFDDNHLPNNNELTFKRIIIKREIIDDEYEAHIPQEGDIREVTPPPAPRAKSRRQSAELAKKRIKLEMRPIEVKMEEDKKNDVNYDSREGSCERSDCPLQKSCCLCISEMCLGSRVDGTGKLYTHITRGEHVCTNCYENVWNRGRNCYDRFMEWRSRWSAESRCSPSAKCFIQEQLLPFWLSCSKCECFRPLPENAPTPSPQEILSFECGRCSDVEDQLALDASERGWVTSMAVPPLLHNSPALIFLHGDSYFYDEIGMSPTNSEFVEGKEPPPSSQFIRPFNMPYESSVAFSLRPDCLEYDEIQAFPEYSIEPVPYLAARNLIIALWAQNPFEYLTPAFCLAHLVIRGLARVWFSCELRRIYDFLNMKGIINYGIIDLPSRPLSVYNDRPLEVIVVGAGISGLAAARQLRSFGVKVKILEAKAKVGGRMQDDWSLGVAVGCGAQLITGIVNNPISLMCQQSGIGYRAVTEGCPLLDAETGKRVDRQVDRIVDEQFNASLDALAHWKEITATGDMSLLEHLESVHKSLLRVGAVRWTNMEERVFHWNIGNTEFSCGAKLSEVSARHWDQNESLVQFAGSHALLTEGTSEIISRLSEGTDIRCNTIVEKINYEKSKKRIMVYCKGGKRFTCDKVIVAIPLAVLKQQSIQYVPALPERKIRAIRELGAGLIEKVAVRFPRRFWSCLLKEDGTLDYFGHVPKAKNQRGLFNMFYDFSTRTGSSKNHHYVLMSYVCGDSVSIVNEMSDVEVVRLFVETLEDIFPEENIPDPDGFVVTHWGRDPFIGMSYSFVQTGASGDHYDWLAEDVDKRIHFAGEGTNRFFPQTMTGAYLSGLREAGKVVEDWSNM